MLNRFGGLDLASIDSLAASMGLTMPMTAEKQIRAVEANVSQLINSGDCFRVGVGDISTYLPGGP